MTKYVGADVHEQTCHMTVMDEQGNVIKQRSSLTSLKNSRGSSRNGFSWKDEHHNPILPPAERGKRAFVYLCEARRK